MQPAPACARLVFRVWRRPIHAVPGLVIRRRGQHRVLALLRVHGHLSLRGVPGAATGWSGFFADLRSMDSVTTLREQFNACGLTVEMETDITTNVLTALRLDNARKLELIDAWIPRVFHRPFGVFAGIAGTRNYAGLESGKLRYLSAQLAKSTPAQA